MNSYTLEPSLRCSSPFVRTESATRMHHPHRTSSPFTLLSTNRTHQQPHASRNTKSNSSDGEQTFAARTRATRQPISFWRTLICYFFRFFISSRNNALFQKLKMFYNYYLKTDILMNVNSLCSVVVLFIDKCSFFIFKMLYCMGCFVSILRFFDFNTRNVLNTHTFEVFTFLNFLSGKVLII